MRPPAPRGLRARLLAGLGKGPRRRLRRRAWIRLRAHLWFRRRRAPGARRRAAGLGLRSADDRTPEDESLLPDGPEVARDPVDRHAGRQVQREHSEQQRHDLAHHLHLLCLLARGHGRDLLLLVPGRGDHGEHQHVVGESVDQADFVLRRHGRDTEVHPEEAGLPEADRPGQRAAGRQVLHPDVPGGTRMLADRLAASGEHAVERQEDRELEHQRQAPAQRVDLVLLVELHHLFVELLAVPTLVLGLEGLDLRLQLLHLLHRARLLDRQRQHHQPDGCGQQDDGDEEVEELVEELDHGTATAGLSGFVRSATVTCPVPGPRSGSPSPAGASGARPGTRSMPPGFQGWHRPRRRTASQPPRTRPCVARASCAYAEQEG